MAGSGTVLACLVTLCCMAPCSWALELESSLLETMDDYVFAMEKERSTIDFTKEIEVGESPSLSDISSAMRVEGEKIAARRKASRAGSLPMRFSSSGRKLSYPGGLSSTGTYGPEEGFWPGRGDVLREEFHIPSYEKPKPKIDFKALLKKLKKGDKKKKQGKIPMNKNLQAMNQIQNGMLEAGAMNDSANEASLLKQIQQACSAKQYLFARQLLGHNIYNLRKEVDGQQPKRKVESIKEILDRIKKLIGQQRYKELMAYDGGVTLAFALDTTGSMYDDIDAAKNIVFGIVTQDRAFTVDYILSPFNDPVTNRLHGPVTYMNKTKKYEFLDLVTQIVEGGGGDCDELAITGIKEIFASPLQYRSPIYVITDAGAKDANVNNLEMVKEMVLSFKTPLNFYLSNAGCLTNSAIDVYKSLARFSGGQILYFSNKKEIASTTNFIQKALIGGCMIPVERGQESYAATRARRSVEELYEIVVDDSIDVLSTAVMDRFRVNVELYNPAGQLQVKGKMDTGKGALFLVEKPTPGRWKLKCPACSSKSLITSNGISQENIDFEYNFLVDVTVGANSKAISSSYPIKGQLATVVITVPAHAKIQTSSLKLKAVNSELETKLTVALSQYGRSVGRYKASFPTPSHDFSLVLEGKTNHGKDFRRLGSGIVEPKTAVIHILSAPNGFVIERGSSTSLVFALHCYNRREKFYVKVNELHNLTIKKPKALHCTPNKMSMFTVSFKAPITGKKGNTHNAVVTVSGRRSGTKASKLVQLLIV